MTTLNTNPPLHRPAGTGDTYIGPGDSYRFLVTGEETGGAYFAMEALVPPGGGPPPHIHHNEDETFYIVEGEVTIRLGDRTVIAGVGDFVNVPRGSVHCFKNEGTRRSPRATSRQRPDTASSSSNTTSRPPRRAERSSKHEGARAHVPSGKPR